MKSLVSVGWNFKEFVQITNSVTMDLRWFFRKVSYNKWKFERISFSTESDGHCYICVADTYAIFGEVSVEYLSSKIQS